MQSSHRTPNSHALLTTLIRINANAESVTCTMLSVVDGHDNFPVTSLRILCVDDAPPKFLSPQCVEWSVVSGGGGGNVAQWSILGLAGERHEVQETQASGTISLCRTGEYKVRTICKILRLLRMEKWCDSSEDRRLLRTPSRLPMVGTVHSFPVFSFR